MCMHSRNKNRRRIDRRIPGLVALALPLFAATASWADPADVIACQAYANVALFQVHIALPLSEGGTGNGCRGAVGPRWSNKTEDHFTWCLEAPPEARDIETRNRRNFLKACAAKKARYVWPEWDETSCKNFSGGIQCSYSPDAHGEGNCNNQGKAIIESVEKINKDPSLLFDHNRDQGLNESRYYIHFSHWRTFRCEQRPGTSGTTQFVLVGYAGGVRDSKPNFPIGTTLPPTDKVPKPSESMRKKLF